LLENYDLLREIERQGTHVTIPLTKVVIADSGELPMNTEL
jgi:hypothetical protein